ncbi:TIGR04255 family protein [bacterium]|nr:MAG: TIGR04255 family protein [bacterium]
MEFRRTKRVAFKKNPLEVVICQLRFADRLEIEAERPVQFQELVRSYFPSFSEQVQQVAPAVTDDVLKALGGMPRFGRTYLFSSADKKWELSLARGAIALTCTAYTKWEQFAGMLFLGVDSMAKAYNIDSYTRVGLRYRDVVRRSSLDLQSRPWHELLRQRALGLLGIPEFSDSVEGQEHHVLLRLDKFNARVRIQHGLAIDNRTEEQCYVIDSDFYKESVAGDKNVRATLKYFNRQSGRLFRWFTRRLLRQSLDPYSPS